MNWNWDHLRFFLSLADTGSLSLAAKALGVSHTTVLRRVRSIEQALETHLFDHTSQGYKLTPAGLKLQVEVQKMKAGVESISRKISGVDQLIEGPVVITTTDTLGCFFLPTIIKQLCRHYPELSVTLRVSNSIADISNREADIAIRTSVNPPPQLVGRKVGHISFATCASEDYLAEHKASRLAAGEASQQYILLDQSFADTPLCGWLDKDTQSQSKVLTASGLLTAYHLCVAGAGITLLPTYLIGQENNLVRLAPELEAIENELWLLSHVDLRDTLRIRLVKRYLYDALRPHFS